MFNNVNWMEKKLHINNSVSSALSQLYLRLEDDAVSWWRCISLKNLISARLSHSTELYFRYFVCLRGKSGRELRLKRQVGTRSRSPDKRLIGDFSRGFLDRDPAATLRNWTDETEVYHRGLRKKEKQPRKRREPKRWERERESNEKMLWSYFCISFSTSILVSSLFLPDESENF